MGITFKYNNTPGGKRTVLGEQLPLNTPFLIQIFPVYRCNFKCKYCLHALPKIEHEDISEVMYMDMDMFIKYVNEMKLFEKKIKMLRFAGIGEPLLHKDIIQMVSYAKKMNIAESIDIVTNGLLLTKTMSDGLIEAGLDRLRISIQGTSEQKYKDICGATIKLEEFIKNIKYFYENRKNTTVYIKIIDCALDGEDDEMYFHELFGDICDTIAIEHMTPTVEGIDYSSLSESETYNQTQNGGNILNTDICPQPFYMMQLNPDGIIVPCCSTKYPLRLKILEEKTLEEIWNGEKFNWFRRSMLDGINSSNTICSECTLYKYGLFKEDVLDNYVEILKGVY